jgi:hypothetical protein
MRHIVGCEVVEEFADALLRGLDGAFGGFA